MLTLVDINEAAVAETEAVIKAEGGTTLVCHADVTKTEDVKRIINSTVAEFGAINVLVNNVEIVELGDVIETSEEWWDRVHSGNLRSAFLTMKYAIPQMLETGGGSIVNVSSAASIRSGVPFCSYASSKAALN